MESSTGKDPVTPTVAVADPNKGVLPLGPWQACVQMVQQGGSEG